MPWFTGPHVTSVGGTTNFRPEMAANISGGGFSYFFVRPDYQDATVIPYLLKYPEFYPGYYKCVRCQTRYRDLTLSCFVTCAAGMVVATPTFPRKRSIMKLSSTARCFTWMARPVRFQCVFPYSLLYVVHP